MKLNKVLAGLALATVAAAALATVTFSPATGTGWVGKGDVQLAFGWNNKALQQNFAGVTFTFVERTDYAITCEWTTGVRNPTLHVQTKTKTVGVNGTLASDARKNSSGKDGEVTGFFLTGYGTLVTEGGNFTAPLIGDKCPANNQAGVDDGKVVTDVSITGTGASLNAVSNGVSVKIWPPVAPIIL
ncbi:MAG TPA: hypothetical protein VLA61_18750 [Ideonella sp.]|uniref:hypothetical protein n=1 Tax=Ideonella sp. TaxID=1929293 RepID=UPI002CAE2FE7|nr:hypothetical protein [Ideonella sp.]HSI50315.1 hypothetical protein [Ideonella sp.]